MLMDRTKTNFNIKLVFSITRATVNHFQKQTHHETQHGETYQKHLMILEIERVEILLIFEANGKTVVVWCFNGETDELEASYS